MLIPETGEEAAGRSRSGGMIFDCEDVNALFHNGCDAAPELSRRGTIASSRLCTSNVRERMSGVPAPKVCATARRDSWSATNQSQPEVVMPDAVAMNDSLSLSRPSIWICISLRSSLLISPS